jgi:hypothetical protein
VTLSPLPIGSEPIQAIPNNLGPTFLIIIGMMLMPVLVGLPLFLLGLTRLREGVVKLALY